MAVTWKQLAYISDAVYDIGWNGITGEAPSKNVVYDEMETKPNKTTAAWSKSIGSGGDYATWAAMIADMPDLIAHATTVTIKAGTTLTETCNLRNKHGLTTAAAINIKAEKFFPNSGTIPTADSATSTTLRDTALATAAKGDDYFNDCWVFIVDGTGTDNGYVPITDYIDSTGDVVVASWPGTQPDNTSRYLIVGALVDSQATRKYCADIQYCTCPVYFFGVGFYDCTNYGVKISKMFLASFSYCGANQITYAGIYAAQSNHIYVGYSGIVKCNVNNDSSHGGVTLFATLYGDIRYCGVSDNNRAGLLATRGSYLYSRDNFGDANGTWGTYAQKSGQVLIGGVSQCSGSSGNNSDPGSAGTASADQAAAY